MALPGPLEDVSLTLKELTGEAGLQGNLFQDIRRRNQLRQAIAQLKASQGRNPIYEVKEVEPWSRIPERRRALVTYDP
jgi:DNA polymerase-4/protein ImuB